MCVKQTNNRQTLLFLFIFESRSGYQSKQFTDACLNFETLLSSYRLSFSDILYDEGAILNHDNTCPCNPLRRKKKNFGYYQILHILHKQQQRKITAIAVAVFLVYSGIFNELQLFIFSNRLCYSGEKAKKNILCRHFECLRRRLCVLPENLQLAP